MNNAKYNIILADDHEIFLESLSALIEAEENLHVVSCVNNGRDLVSKVKESKPDLCIVDMDMPEMNGLQASEILLKSFPDLRILVLTMHKEKSLVKKMMSLGIKGYLIKTCDKEEFLFAINRILKNKTHFSEEIIETIVSEPKISGDNSGISKIALLSQREKEIIRLLCKGLSNNQIAGKLFISSKTVDNHRTNLMHKLDVHNVVELIRFCLKHGLAE